MTDTEAEKILKAWQEFMEVWDKFNALMLSIPPSFYPYPPEQLEEGLEIMEKRFAEIGDIKMANAIQVTRTSMWGKPENDEEALESMRKRLNMMFENPDFKKTLLEKLHKVRDQWIIIRDKGKIIDR